MFGYLNLDRAPSRDWYCELLSLSLTDTNKSIHINTRNCVGTVLSLCSLKKYFCMYHTKHPESLRHVSRKYLVFIHWYPCHRMKPIYNFKVINLFMACEMACY